MMHPRGPTMGDEKSSLVPTAGVMSSVSGPHVLMSEGC
jgi:hypothetical protein